jgi:hypothetical protein
VAVEKDEKQIYFRIPTPPVMSPQANCSSDWAGLTGHGVAEEFLAADIKFGAKLLHMLWPLSARNIVFLKIPSMQFYLRGRSP